MKLNLIDVSDDTGRYRRATPDELAAFRDALDALGVPVVRRYSGGSDIGAACGTLAATRARRRSSPSSTERSVRTPHPDPLPASPRGRGETGIFLPLPLAGEGRGEGKPLSAAFASAGGAWRSRR